MDDYVCFCRSITFVKKKIKTILWNKEGNIRVFVVMKSKTIFVIIVLIIVLAVGIIVVSGASIWGGGYRVDVYGTVYFHPLDEDDWSSTLDDVIIEIDQTVFTFSDGLWFWETDTVEVEVELWGDNKYTASADIGTMFITGDQKSFTVTLRHVEEGLYTGYIRVYELQGGFFGIGAERVLQDENSFDLDVGD
jgi:hypothetical protein